MSLGQHDLSLGGAEFVEGCEALSVGWAMGVWYTAPEVAEGMLGPFLLRNGLHGRGNVFDPEKW